jgi:hypothetical protein
MPVKLGNHEHWNKRQLDVYLERLATGGAEWFKGSPLFKDEAA